MTKQAFPHFRTVEQLKAGVYTWQIVSPILIILGTIGNALSIIILLRPRFRKWSSTVYLVGLSVADLAVLYIGLLRQWVKYSFGKDIRSVSTVLCKTHWWLLYTTTDVSVWILTAITVERLLGTACPYKSKVMCTPTRAKVVIAVISICALTINSHLIYGVGHDYNAVGNGTDDLYCVPLTDSYKHFFYKIWTWVDLCKFSLVPFLVLSTGNICILVRLVSINRKLKSHNSSSTSLATSMTSSTTSSMSGLLIGLNCVFIVCTLPVCVYLIGETYWIPQDIPISVRRMDHWWAFVNMLMYISNSSNFILYCITGSRFRNEVKKLFKYSFGSQEISRVNNGRSLSGPV